MWEEGSQNRPKHKDVLAECEALKGYLDDRKAMVSLVEFLRNDPTFAANLLLGVKLFPFQHMLIKGMFNTDYFLGVISRAASKCSEENSLVITDSGLKKIIDVEVGEKILSKEGYNLVEGKTVNPKEKTYKLVTKSGYETEGLDYHRVLVLNPDLSFDWKFSKDVKPGEVLVMKRGEAEFPEQGWDFRQEFNPEENVGRSNFNPLNASLEEWYYFFGLYIGDGYYTPSDCTVTNQEPEIIDFLVQFFEKIGLSPKKIRRETVSETYNVTVYSVDFSHFLTKVGFSPCRAFQKVLPYKFTNASKACLSEYLKGLYDTDGYCCTKTGRKTVSLGFTSCSYELIKQTRSLLLMMGISSNTKVCFPGGEATFSNGKKYNCRKAWCLYIYGSTNQQKFYECAGFRVKRKQETLALAYDVDSCFCDGVPFVGDYLREKFNKKGFSFFSDGKKTSFHFSKNTPKKSLRNFVVEAKARHILDELDETKFDTLAREDLFFEPVAEVIEGEAVTVDLQVASEHCYVSDGVINHNSFTTAIFAALYAVFEPGVKIGIMSASFRQSKTIIKKLEDIMLTREASLFHQAVTQGKIQKSTDQWTIDIGRSSISAIPLGDGQKLRGFRFNVVIVDEFLLMPERIFNEVIKPFLAANADPVAIARTRAIEDQLIAEGKMREEERMKFSSNKIIMLSSAGFKFDYIYKVYCEYERMITMDKEKRDVSDDVSRAIFHTSYKIIPKAIYDEKLINESKETMSESQFAREFGSVFTDDSSGYFKMSSMIRCTLEEGDGQSVEIYGDPKAKYILAFDPSWSESEASDNFAIQVLKLDEEKKNAILVHGYAIPGTPLTKHIKYFKYLLDSFNIVAIVGDYNGGVQFINSCNLSQEFKDAKLELKTFEFDAEDMTAYKEELAKLVNVYNYEDKRICHLRKPSSQWIRQANEKLQSAFDHKKMLFAAAAVGDEFRAMCKHQIPNLDEFRFCKNIDNPTIVDFIERQKEVVEATKNECSMINPRQSATGTQIFDLPENLRHSQSPNKPRKDSYSALVLGNWMAQVWFDMQDFDGVSYGATFTPFII
jgi:hypothetical protein